jgi:hypothetical protein
MEAESVEHILCPVCDADLPPALETCPQCGTSTRAGTSVAPPTRRGTPGPGDSTAGLLDRPWVVLCLLFFVMAILGLPLLWKSRAFSAPMKILLSVVVTLYTIALFGAVGLILHMAVTSVREAMG